MFIHIAWIAVGADVDISYWLLNLKMLNKFLHPSFAVLCEWSFAAGLDLFTWSTNLCRTCFSTFCIPVGAAFTGSEFDRADGLGFAFDIFCVTLLFLASQSLLLLNCWHCQELLYYFFDWRWIKISPKRLRIKMYSFLKAFLVLMKLLSLSQFYAPKNIALSLNLVTKNSEQTVIQGLASHKVYCTHNNRQHILKIFRACMPKNVGASFPCFGVWYPQGVRVPPVKNHWPIVMALPPIVFGVKCEVQILQNWNFSTNVTHCK